MLLLQTYQRNRNYEDEMEAKEKGEFRDRHKKRLEELRKNEQRYRGEANRSLHSSEQMQRTTEVWASRNAANSYGRVTREVNRSVVSGWYEALAHGEITLEESSPTILHKARALSRILTKKCRAELAKLDKTDPEWEYNVLEVKQKLMLEHRFVQDQRLMTIGKAKRRHRGRLKTVMKNAVRLSLIHI